MTKPGEMTDLAEQIRTQRGRYADQSPLKKPEPDLLRDGPGMMRDPSLEELYRPGMNMMEYGQALERKRREAAAAAKKQFKGYCRECGTGYTGGKFCVECGERLI